MRCLAVLLAICIAQAVSATDPAPRAIENEPRIWRAISGDMVELDGEIFRLHGVQCPELSVEEGRSAKALLNTFLRGGDITCRVWQSPQGPQAQCAKEGRDVATGMLRSGLCRPHLTGPRREAEAEAGDILRLGSTARDRRQYVDNLCNPRSLDTEGSVAFLNRCPNEVLRNAIDTQVENQLREDRSGLTRRNPFPFGALSR
ncbi:MAG: hypothetical protein AAF922_10350 [Pseudomonadota bacterium]